MRTGQAYGQVSCAVATICLVAMVTCFHAISVRENDMIMKAGCARSRCYTQEFS